MSEEKHEVRNVDSADDRPPGMPRWVKVTAIVVGALVLLFLALQLTGVAGQHGPGRHLSESRPAAALVKLAAVESALP
ncbi:hypothetical protein [Modestobacter altitudinis]|uniref:hypothetical protein n=1 Tax=Modestobacter altitudinis TaxID=2213158 RepID=UPI00110CEBDC|nr:hypothetical protein [Modestobacter altitudinis]